MTDNKTEIRIEGNATGWRRAMQEVVQASSDGTRQMESHFGGLAKVFEGVQGKIAAIGAVLAGGAVFKDAVATSAKFAEESIKLGKALGVSATEASTYISTLEDIDVSQEEFVSAAQKLSKQLRDNEADLNAAGLATRDAAGHLKPLNDLTVDAIEVLNGYKEGTDRAVASQVYFGKGFTLTSNLINLNKETLNDNRAAQEALGVVVGRDNVIAWKAFDAMGDRVNLTLKAFKVTIGNALLPVLTDLGNWFNSIGPGAALVFKGAIGGLAATFHGVTTGVTALWETVNAFVYAVAEPLIGLSNAIALAITGNFSAAGERLKAIAPNISNAWEGAFARMAAKASETRARLLALFGSPEAAGASPEGRSAEDLIKQDPPKGPKAPRATSIRIAREADPSLMQYYEAALSEEKRLAAERNALREYTKQEELAFWKTLLQYADLNTKDRIAIEKKAADLAVAIAREEAKQKLALQGETARHEEAMQMGALEARKAAARLALDLGQITKAQYLKIEEGFENQRWDIQRAALEERMKLLQADPNANPVEYARLKNQILELEQQHQLALQNIQGKQAIETRNGGIFGDIAGSFGRGLETMMQSAEGWRDGIYQILAGVRDAFIRNLVTEPLQKYIAGEARKLALKMGFVAQEKSIDSAAAATTVATKAGEATAVVSANAAEAASGAAASQASIPFVGPGLAIAAFAGMMALVMGAMSRIRSAAGGYDIPRGLNPMTQLHEQEMVLPKSIANPLREMLASGGQGHGQGGPANVRIINTTDPAVIRDWLQGPEGTQIITNTLRANPELVRRVAVG
jgi:hypothetical protein